MPFRLGADAIAGHPRLIVHNGDAPTCDSIEQGGLADVGPTDDGD